MRRRSFPTRRIDHARAAGFASLAALVGFAGPSVADGSTPTARTTPRNAPAIRATSAGRYVVQDGPVSAAFTNAGFSASLGSLAPSGVRWTLVGARAVAPVRDAPRTGAPAHEALVYEDVYPGVQLTLESRRHGLAYRFDVAPGADAGAIRMRYAGARRIVTESGGRGLRVRVGDSWLSERGLRCFQEPDGAERVTVPCHYVTRASDEVSIAVDPHDRRRTLVIDPEIGWSTYLGGSNVEEGRGVAVDTAGNVYVVGDTFSSDFPAGGAFDSTLDGTQDAFVVKIAAGGGSLEWAAFLGGSADEHGRAIAVDDGGDVYVTGDTDSSDFPTLLGFDTMHAGVEDGFVTKISTTGTLVWSSYLGGVQPDEGRAIAVDANGHAYVTGHTLSTDFPAAGGFDATLTGGDDAFVTKVDASGSVLAWSSFLGGDSDDIGNAIAVDAIGDVYVAGRTISLDFATAGAFDETYDGGAEAFVTEITADGLRVWASYLGGVGSDEARGIAVDASGDVYVTGQTGSTNFPVTGGFDDTLQGSLDAFLVKVDESGASLAWGTFLGGSGVDSGFSVAVDSAGASYLAGETNSTDFPTTDGFDDTLDGARDAFVAKVDASGAILDWSSYVGGGASDSVRALALDPNGNPVLVGKTPSDDLPTPGGFDTTLGGSSDAFVFSVAVCGNGICETSEDTCICPEDCGADACGNGCCGPLENECTCPADCGPECGDGCCGSTEDECVCPEDCGEDTCGNGCCGSLENACDCPADCGEDTCGNGCCGLMEDACNCPEDCEEDDCNNGCCGPLENACNCPDDCEHECGDGCCRAGEDCETCPDDCGECRPQVEVDDPPACSCDLGRRATGGSLMWWLPLALLGRRRRVGRGLGS